MDADRLAALKSRNRAVLAWNTPGRISNTGALPHTENEVAKQTFFPINRPTGVSAFLASRMRFAETQFDRPLACEVQQETFREVSP